MILPLRRALPLFALTLATGCAGTRPVVAAATAAAPAPRFSLAWQVDSARATTLAAGATHHFLYLPTGPWAIHILEIDRGRCWAPRTLKAGGVAVGRERTSELLRQAARTETVIGGVNADFFLFTPPGVPVGASITHGRVVAGPIERPVLAFGGDDFAYHIGRLFSRGVARFAGDSVRLTGWNRVMENGFAAVDSAWGTRTDTASGRIEVTLSGSPLHVIALDTTLAGVDIPRSGWVLVAGRNAPAAARARLLALSPGTDVDLGVELEPFHPFEAVGGQPVIVRDSVIPANVDSVGGAGFATGRHPRTAVGISRDGKHVFLVVVDGRQAPYSDGMSLRELANLMLGLGVPEAINLDGGGSSAMVVADPRAAGGMRVVNKFSDAAGERPVANALAFVKC